MRFTTIICQTAKEKMAAGATRSEAFKMAFAASRIELLEMAIATNLFAVRLTWATINGELRTKVAYLRNGEDKATWGNPAKPAIENGGRLLHFWVIDGDKVIYNSLYENLLLGVKLLPSN